MIDSHVATLHAHVGGQVQGDTVSLRLPIKGTLITATYYLDCWVVRNDTWLRIEHGVDDVASAISSALFWDHLHDQDAPRHPSPVCEWKKSFNYHEPVDCTNAAKHTWETSLRTLHVCYYHRTRLWCDEELMRRFDTENAAKYPDDYDDDYDYYEDD